MRQATRWMGLVAWAVAAGACAGGDAHETLARDQVRAVNELADAVAAIKDQASAQAAASHLAQAVSRLRDLKTRGEALAQRYPERDAELKRQLGGEMSEAMGRLRASAVEAAPVPGARAAIEEALKALKVE